MMYDFLLRMWVQRRVTETQLQNYADYGFITQEQADSIIATPQEQQ
ncbi:hypothetical protein [Tuberibacillus sp. Marseille-P3662]|nr:hypothetical protein [Tuberibacillus sp. Marseille-P3662]